jgi:hypothetical protein
MLYGVTLLLNQQLYIYISQAVRVHQLVVLLDFSAVLRMTQICLFRNCADHNKQDCGS